MKSKVHILVVEDKALIYKRLKMLLKDHYYSVEDFTPSVKQAIVNINKQRPDLVLLDIDLQGEHKGTYLGELLNSKYKIPFIYVTDFDDNQTFYEGLKTKHGDFISKNKIHLNEEENVRVISTKPHLDKDRLIRSIQTVLELRKKENLSFEKTSILAYVDYVKKTKEYGEESVSKVPVVLKEIAFFTTNSEEIDEEKTKQRKRTVYKKLHKNNVRIYTWLKKSYIVPSSLATLQEKIPPYFVRINDYYIVNLDNEFALQGRVKGKYLKIADEILEISDRYKAAVEKKFDLLYYNLK